VNIMKFRAALLATLLALFAGAAFAQSIPGSLSLGGYTQTGVLVTSSQSWTVPGGVTVIYVDGCAAGGGGGLGQVGAATAGGAGAGSGSCVRGFPLQVTPGATLTLTVGAGVVNGTGGNTTITGANNPFPTLLGGTVGNPGAAGTGGAGGNGGGPNGGAGGAAGAAGAGTLAAYTNWGGFYLPGSGGGGGGNTAGTAGSGATASLFTPAVSAGAGNGAGGGGAGSPFGNGGVGGIGGSPGLAPTTGFGGGAGGDGTNNTTAVAGANGFALIRY
jgi:hypothetical protein